VIINGILNLRKPAGLRSTRAVTRIKHMLPRHTKIGHAGTLDTFASGVLLVLVGRATKLSEALMSSPKQYVATLRLGATTVTHDPDSPEVPTAGATPVEKADLERVLQRFSGNILQHPPIYSALKIGGMRSSDRVRLGESPVAPQPRVVRIDAVDLLSYEWPIARIRVDCGRGTYVRSIARDIGDALGVGAYLSQLIRTRVGDFYINDAHDPIALSPDNLESMLASVPVPAAQTVQ